MQKFSSQLSDSYTKLFDKLSEWLDTAILHLPNLFIAILISVLAFFSYRFIKRIAVKAASRFTSNKTVLNLVSNLSAVIFSLFILFIILGIFNLGGTINKILATAGVLGLAIGLALQDPMNNLFSGVFMSVRKLYKIGDMVETNGYFGTIIDIDLRATKLFLPSGQHVVIPNKDVIQNPLINYSTSGARRVEIECGVGYGDRLKDIESVVIGAIAKLHNLNAEKEVDFFFTEFGGSSINFKVRFWLNDTDQKSFLKDQSKGIIAIKEAFDDSGINIPFPITTLDFGNIENLDLQETLARNSEKLNPKSHTPINIKNN